MTDRPLTILIVDDSMASRELTAAQLMVLGHRARCVAGGEAALAALDAGAYDLVLTDLRMAGMDGYELAGRVLGRAAPPRVLVLSAAVGPGERERCRLAGIERCLQRPVELAELRAALAGQPAPGPAAPPLVALDLERLDAILAQMGAAGREMLGTMAVVFLEHTPRDLAALAAAEGREAARLAHLIKGRALSLGANRLAAGCVAVEEGRGRGDLEGLYAEAADLLRGYLAALEARPVG